jgi:hypothetical protein
MVHTVCGGYLWEVGVNGGDEGQAIELMGFIYIKEIE